MTNKKITDLVELTTPTTDDVFPLVDIATNSTKKAQLANLPISTATQTALDAKQATLVSGTNIKTINSTSLLGSGDISVVASPAGTAGQIQFTDGSAFAADSNLYWDNTNKWLGVGTNAPTSALTIQGADGTVAQKIELLASNGSERGYFYGTAAGTYLYGGGNGLYLGNTWYDRIMKLSYLGTVGIGTGTLDPTARLHVKGSGSTSATTSLLVQNSSGTNWLEVKDNGDITNAANAINQLQILYSPTSQFFRLRNQSVNVDFYAGDSGNALIQVGGGLKPFNISAGSANFNLSNGGVRIGSSYATTNASAQLEVTSTTKGFLPPRMTTTQKNAIASPAAGLMVYDTDTNKLCCYNGTTWNDLF